MGGRDRARQHRKLRRGQHAKPRLIDVVRKTTDKPVRLLLNTRHHSDHMYGSRAIFGRTRAALVASSGITDVNRAAASLGVLTRRG
jgi:hypothetical protein